MKYVCLIGVLVIGLFHIGAQAAGAETIRMGYFEIKPHMYRPENGSPADTMLPSGSWDSLQKTTLR